MTGGAVIIIYGIITPHTASATPFTAVFQTQESDIVIRTRTIEH
jgi:hypothetical protein